MEGLKSRPQKKKLSKNLLEMKSSQVLVVPQESLESNPHCPHGPTVLFRRTKEGKEFHACSAFRDPKLCSKSTPRKRTLWLGDKATTDLVYCHTCETLDKGSSSSHAHHDTSTVDIRFPSTFLKALHDDKAQAQYHFNTASSDFILSAILHQKKTAVLCLGTPTLHEKLLEKGMASLLLDIDGRYAAFYPMLLYNMFNHHFFDSEDKDVYLNFLRENAHGSLSVVLDPPFGGRTELLGASLRSIQKDWKGFSSTNPRVFWVFPYFMENNVVEAWSEMRMMGIPIEYHNHAKYSRRKQGSPVRLFTNVSYKDIPLLGQMKRLFRRCHICLVITGGTHCEKCNVCPSKNGGAYVHCDRCKRCVKDSWAHCKKCNRCALPDHPCDFFMSCKKVKLDL